jgi:peptide-methionine (S)-S-oxide reductase
MLLFAWLACSTPSIADPGHDTSPAPIPEAGPGQAVAVFAGGCFWCMEADFDKLDGVVHTTSGYIGGAVDHPTYYQVGTGGTGHTEAVRVVYDSKKLTYDQVLTWFWHHVDPTDGGGQFCDRGDQYRPGIYPVDDAQRAAAEAGRKAVAERLHTEIPTEIKAGQTFWPAEVYHQDYWKHDPGRYQPYRAGCGRDARVAKVWGPAAH